jgi:hypothetical protein
MKTNNNHLCEPDPDWIRIQRDPDPDSESEFRNARWPLKKIRFKDIDFYFEWLKVSLHDIAVFLNKLNCYFLKK